MGLILLGMNERLLWLAKFNNPLNAGRSCQGCVCYYPHPSYAFVSLNESIQKQVCCETNLEGKYVSTLPSDRRSDLNKLRNVSTIQEKCSSDTHHAYCSEEMLEFVVHIAHMCALLPSANQRWLVSDSLPAHISPVGPCPASFGPGDG